MVSNHNALLGIYRYIATHSRFLPTRLHQYLFPVDGNKDAMLSALKPFAALWKGLKETFKPYPSLPDVRRDTLQLFYGLAHMARGILKLIVIPLLVVFHVLQSVFTLRPIALLMTLPYAFSWLLESVGDVVRGVVEVATFPLTLLVRMPLRSMLRSDSRQVHDDEVVLLSGGEFSGNATPSVVQDVVDNLSAYESFCRHHPDGLSIEALNLGHPLTSTPKPSVSISNGVIRRLSIFDFGRTNPTPTPEATGRTVHLDEDMFSPGAPTPWPVEQAEQEPEAFQELRSGLPLVSSQGPSGGQEVPTF